MPPFDAQKAFEEIQSKIETSLAGIEKKVDDQIASIKSELKLPVTRNALGIEDANERSRIEVLGPAYESLDPLKGKGLMFARAARVLCEADRVRRDPREIAKAYKLPDGYIERVMEVNVAKALGESTVGAGGVLVPDQFSMEFIELLRARVVLINSGIIRIPMSSKTLTIGRQAGAATATWIGESQNLNKSEQTFDSIQLDLKKLGCLTPISNDLLRDNAIAADIIVRNDLLQVAIREMDLKAIRGVGTVYTPKGLLNLMAAANQFDSFAAGVPTLITAQKDLNKAIRLVKEANVPFTKQTAGWIMSPRTESGYHQLTDGVGRPFYAEEMDRGTLLGYPYLVTTAIPNNLTGGGSGGVIESEVYFVVFDQFYQGEGMMPTIEVARNAAYYDGANVQSGLSRDETAVSVIVRTDFQMRHPGAASRIRGVVEGSV